VLLPAASTSLARLRELVDAQKPAHTAATVRIGGGGFIVGAWAAVGVDSVLGSVAAPVLGAAGNVRLSRMTVLWPGRDGRGSGVAVGTTARVGEGTVMQ
jgi:hypothetical protein